MKVEELERFARAEGYRLVLLRGHGICVYQRDAAKLMGLSLRQFYDAKREQTAPASVNHNRHAWIPLTVLAEFL